MNVEIWKNQLNSVSSPEKAKILSRFFKTGKGEYGEGDIFIGITVPQNRSISKSFYSLSLSEISDMLNEPIHEYRLAALLALIEKFKKSNPKIQKEIVGLYLASTGKINNWDLVDLSCPQIIGEYVLKNNLYEIIYDLSNSTHLWEQRISIVSTIRFIRNGKFDTTLKIAGKFLSHDHDLIQKASGWMLREVGKKDEATLTGFLNRYYTMMPRTTLRYAIERLDKEAKSFYMKRK